MMEAKEAWDSEKNVERMGDNFVKCLKYLKIFFLIEYCSIKKYRKEFSKYLKYQFCLMRRDTL